MSSSSSWLPTFGLVQKTRGRHSRASRLDHLGFADDVRFAAHTNHFVSLVFQLEQSRSTFVVFGVFGTVGARKPVVVERRLRCPCQCKSPSFLADTLFSSVV